MVFFAACTRSISTPPPSFPFLEPTPSPEPSSIPFPITLASTWIYDYRAYTEGQQAAWVVTETILDVQRQNDMLIATVQRDIRLVEGQETGEILTAPRPETFWYILRGGELYRQFDHLDLTNFFTNTNLELFFPVETVPCWYIGETLGPAQKGESGCRMVDTYQPTYQTPAGTFDNCLELITPYLSGVQLDVFCPHLGFVAGKYDHLGSSFGYEFKLIGYSLPEP